MESLRDLWHELQSRERYTLFQSYQWNLLAARAFGARESPHVIAVQDDATEAIIPACASPSGLSFLGDSLFDYRDILCRGAAYLGQAWQELANFGKTLKVTSLGGREVRDRWQGMGLDAGPFVSAPCVLRSDTDAESFEGRHHWSARLVRRLNRLGVSVHEHSGKNSALVRSIYRKKADQVLQSGDNLFADSARRDFLVAVAALGRCDVFTLETPGALVAAIITFRDGDFRRFYTTYYDHAWARYSPGTALLFEVTRRSLAAGLDCDYMTGEQPYKLRFATSAVPLYRVMASAAVLADISYPAGFIAA